MKHAIAIIALALATPAAAQEATYAEVMALPVPVTAGDITDRPYIAIGKIEDGIRKATVFSKSVSEEKVYRELWERGRKMGADAVIRAEYGKSHMTFTSWGSRKISGWAVKFVDERVDAGTE